MTEEELKRAEEAIGYHFSDPTYLLTAFTHSSYLNEHRNEKDCYERLEFLGDAVLELISSEYLYLSHADNEGILTRTRAMLVCEESLARFARGKDLGRFLRISKGETLRGMTDQDSVLCDVAEAVLGAIYLDGGYGPARDYILPYLRQAESTLHFHDYKTMLQEIIQKNKGEKIRYEIVGVSGPDHSPVFHCDLYLNSNNFSSGEGRSKKQAEQDAAHNALLLMGMKD